VRKYEAHCEQLGETAFPVNYDSLGTYLVAFVRRNGGSTRSVANVKSQLKTTAERRGLGWLTKADLSKLNRLVAEMKMEDHGETDRKLPLVTELIKRMLDLLDMTKEADLLFATLLTVGHDGLLRLGELCSGLCKEDFVWWAKGEGVSILLNRTKTHRVGGAVKVDLVDTDSPFSGVKLLRRWWEKRRLGAQPERTIVFPDVLGKQQHMGDGTVKDNWVRQMIKKAAARLGLDPRRYSGHSLRAGGATDLFVARVPYFIIKRMGRWTTDAAMIYYRSEEDVRREVRRAFSRMARECGAVAATK
jgi:integrase